MYERVEFVLLLPLGVVEDEVRGKKHEIREFISLRLEALQSEVKHQAAHPTARMQDAYSLTRSWIDRLSKISFDFVYDWLVAHVTF